MRPGEAFWSIRRLATCLHLLAFGMTARAVLPGALRIFHVHRACFSLKATLFNRRLQLRMSIKAELSAPYQPSGPCGARRERKHTNSINRLCWRQRALLPRPREQGTLREVPAGPEPLWCKTGEITVLAWSKRVLPPRSKPSQGSSRAPLGDLVAAHCVLLNRKLAGHAMHKMP